MQDGKEKSIYISHLKLWVRAKSLNSCERTQTTYIGAYEEKKENNTFSFVLPPKLRWKLFLEFFCYFHGLNEGESHRNGLKSSQSKANASIFGLNQNDIQNLQTSQIIVQSHLNALAINKSIRTEILYSQGSSSSQTT